MLLDFSKQCADAMLEGLNNITTQTYCPLCGHKKLNKLHDSKKFSILKKGIGFESEKLWKKDTDQGSTRCSQNRYSKYLRINFCSTFNKP